MRARERLENYLDRLRRRLRTHIYAQAGAAAAAGVLVVTGAAVWLLEREGFAPYVSFAGRAVLVLLLMLVAVLLLWLPLRRLRRDDGAGLFEQRLSGQHGRIEAYLDTRRREGDGASSPLIDLLAEDASRIAEQSPVETVVPSRRIGAGLAVAGVSAIALVLMLTVAPAHWGFGSRHLLLGVELPRDAVPVRRIVVTPGDATVRRNSDFAIRASIEGFDPEQASVFVRFADQVQWERAPMQTAGERGAQYEFKLYALRGPLQYYVEAEGTRSSEHSVAVVDLPRIERVRLTYSYPEWTGLEPATEETSRDIRAVAGTHVKVEVFADAPLESPALIVDGRSAELSQDGRASTGTISVEQPGHYQIGARVAGELVALSDEYAIEIVADEKPVIEIQKPGRDWRATSIEEVPVRIEAQDDFRLRDVALRYSVNGGKWQTLPVSAGAKQVDSESLLRLEELGKAQAADAEVQAMAAEAPRLVPGDLVSYYAVARDRKQSVQTDLFMVQVQPFERRFTQGQGGGGGGGMGEEQGDISERQREILLATWNLQRSDEDTLRSSSREERGRGRSRKQLQDSAKMLAELQQTLAQQARTLAERMRARASVEEDDRVRTFVESLERAATVMDPAANHLNEFRLADAVPAEQQALQQLLRAEAAFRDVQVSMQQDNSGGGGSQAARNFAEMFELEMDLQKNQYESQSQLSMENRQRELDEAIRKLKELAERQEKLAQEAKRPASRAEEQRWKQEQLRREAEDLRRRLAEMNRQQPSPGSAGQAQGESQGESQGERGESQGEKRADGQSGGRVANALDSVNRALEDMRSANANRQQERSGRSAEPSTQEEAASGKAASEPTNDAAGEAARKLRQALQQIEQPPPSGLDEALQQFADRTQQLADEQRRIETGLHDALTQAAESSQRMNARGAIDPRRAQELVESKQKMSNELTELQQDMRNAVHDHRSRTPQSTRRLSEIVRGLEGSDIMYRVNRSAAEIYYGRAREAAPREGLITEALETLEQDLREVATLASRETSETPGTVTPETLLAEVAEMRRALQQQQSSGTASMQGGGGTRGLEAWNPSSPSGSLSTPEQSRDSLAQQTAQIGARVRDIAHRMNRGELTQAELNSLRSMAQQLRRLAGDPMSSQTWASQTEAMLQLVDQIELSALAASEKSRDAAAARAAMPAPDSPRYREAVAEYYRRLGDGT